MTSNVNRNSINYLDFKQHFQKNLPGLISRYYNTDLHNKDINDKSIKINNNHFKLEKKEVI